MLSLRNAFFSLLIGLILFFLTGCQNKPSAAKTDNPVVSGPPLFTALSVDQTGVDFQNVLTEGLNTNILVYEYFYNGGGVATGDFNNDGWLDLYFTANLSDNKLYLNTGNDSLRFRDVTTVSGAGGRTGPWKTGVTTVDINADGKLDLYICYSGALPPEKRANQLFVNQGNDASGVPQFIDKAAEYGLASTGFSNQAYFLDYDRDGDLDMLLLNHNPKNLPLLSEAGTAEMLRTDDPERGLRLFKQTRPGHFDDVTQRAGISGSALSYGLGIGIGDFNDDGWPDFYVSNDYTVPDFLYINQQNRPGKPAFTNEVKQQLGHTSQFSMGNDVADINNDGRADIFTLDMLPEDNRRQRLLLMPDNFAKFDLNLRNGFYYQYMRNMLHLNQGNGAFSEVGQQAGVSNTDWSWAALLADFDNDGWKDLFISNGYLRDYTNLDFIKYMDDFAQSRGRLQRQDVMEIITKMPASNVVNYIFRNEKGKSFSNETQPWGLNVPSNSNGAVYADLDNDGDLDLVVNNINQLAFVYRNEGRQQTKQNFLQLKLTGAGGNTQGIGTMVSVYGNGQMQTQMQTLARGYLSAVSPVLHFGLGAVNQLDSVVVVWPGGKRQTLPNVRANQVLTLNEKEATAARPNAPTQSTLFAEVDAPVAFQNPAQPVRDFDRQALLTRELSHSGPCMETADLTGDGQPDLLVGGAAGQPAMLFVQQAGRFVAKLTPAFETDKASHDTDIALFDANTDGFLDVYIASGGYHNFSPDDRTDGRARLQDRLYLNDGKGNFIKASNALPAMPTSTGCVAVGDVNGDGKPDLFVGGRVVPGRYPEAPASYVLLNNGRGQFSDQTARLAPELARIGMVTDAVWTDLNQDRKPELVVVGEWMPVSVFGMEAGKLTNQTSTYFDKTYSGWWNTLTVGDLNGDRKPDLIVGNFGENAQVKATDALPAELYASDFDNNGSVEPILCVPVQGKSQLYVTRDELLTQINGYRARYPNYESYANASLTDIFSEADLKNATHLTANQLQTSCFLSTPAGKFKTAVLPAQAQYAPVYTVMVLDANQDGNKDLLLCGNDSRLKIRLGKMDASYGVLLRGNGKGAFSYVPQTQSGLHLRGDVRSVVRLDNMLLFGLNEQKPVAYRLVNQPVNTTKPIQ